jgi:hypothetical protein
MDDDDDSVQTGLDFLMLPNHLVPSNERQDDTEHHNNKSASKDVPVCWAMKSPTRDERCRRERTIRLAIARRKCYYQPTRYTARSSSGKKREWFARHSCSGCIPGLYRLRISLLYRSSMGSSGCRLLVDQLKLKVETDGYENPLNCTIPGRPTKWAGKGFCIRLA